MSSPPRRSIALCERALASRRDRERRSRSARAARPRRRALAPPARSRSAIADANAGARQRAGDRSADAARAARDDRPAACKSNMSAMRVLPARGQTSTGRRDAQPLGRLARRPSTWPARRALNESSATPLSRTDNVFAGGHASFSQRNPRCLSISSARDERSSSPWRISARLPGTPLYDARRRHGPADRGGRARRREAAGGRRPRDHVRQRERPPLPLRRDPGGPRRDDRGGDGAEADAEGALRRQLSLGPLGERRDRLRDRRRLRARNLHRPVRLRHGAVAAERRRRADASPQSRPARI